MLSQLAANIDKFSKVTASPNGKVITIAVLVCCLPFLAGITFITPTYFGNAFYKVVAKASGDVRVFGYADAARLQVARAEGEKVVLVGASSMRAAFNSSTMEEEAFKLTGKRIPVYNLAVNSQTIMEFLGMVEHIPEGSTGKLLIKVSPISMTRDYLTADMQSQITNPDRFTLLTPALAKEMKALGIRDSWLFDNFFLNNIVYFCARYKTITRNLLLNRRFDEEQVYLSKAKVNQNRWNIQGARVVEAINAYDKNKEINFQYIRSLIAYVKENTEMDIVLVEQLYNPRLFKEFINQSFYDSYQKEISDLAKSLNVSYLDLPKLLNLDADSFYDWTHIQSTHAIDQASRQLIKSSFDESTTREKS